jgi:uncharacterized protein DUF2442
MSSSTVEDDLTVRATHVTVNHARLIVDLQDGRTITTPLEWYPRLMNGTPAEWANYEISPFGIHWEDLNEDISIRGLLLGHRSGESKKSFDRWLSYRARGEKEPILTLPLPPDIEAELKTMGIKTD